MQLPSTTTITTATDTAIANYSPCQGKRRVPFVPLACPNDAAAAQCPCVVLNDDNDNDDDDVSAALLAWDMFGAEPELAPPASIAICVLCSADANALGDSRCDDREGCDGSGEEAPSPLDHFQSITADKRLCIRHYKEWWHSVPGHSLSPVAALCAQDLSACSNTAYEHIPSLSPIRTGSKRHPLAKGRRLDTEDAELSKGFAAVKAQAARDIHGHHAHAYRQDHEGDSARLFDQHVDCIMDALCKAPLHRFESEESVWDHFTREDVDPKAKDMQDVNEMLREFVLDKQSIVLNSAFPDIAPHIVITPPTDPWDGSLAHCWNKPLPQYGEFLTVPLQYQAPEYTPSYAGIEYYGQLSAIHSFEPVERPAIRPSRFLLTSSHREGLTSSYRRLYKMAARTAMLMASKVRQRWDSPAFCLSQERPFVWSDPASPLLVFYGTCRDARIIDSVNPFSAPHIIIHEAPDQAPWEACENRAVVPQHCGYLMVPGVPCFCPPTPPIADTEALYTSAVEEIVAVGQHELSLPQDTDPTEYITAEELGMFSPVDESDSDMPDTPEEEVFRFTISELTDSSMILESHAKLSHEFVLEDDEDDLPPFDEWYQDIAQRAR